jgi:hypothetical protein
MLSNEYGIEKLRARKKSQDCTWKCVRVAGVLRLKSIDAPERT